MTLFNAAKPDDMSIVVFPFVTYQHPFIRYSLGSAPGDRNVISGCQMCAMHKRDKKDPRWLLGLHHLFVFPPVRACPLHKIVTALLMFLHGKVLRTILLRKISTAVTKKKTSVSRVLDPLWHALVWHSCAVVVELSAASACVVSHPGIHEGRTADAFPVNVIRSGLKY